VFLNRLERGFTGILAWEEQADPDELEAFGGELAVLPDQESVLHASWGRYALALAATLRGDHAGALESLRRPLAYAQPAGAATLEWRLHRTAAMAHAGLGDHAAAEASRRHAVAVLRPIVESLPAGPLRDGFAARRDVAEVLSWEA
jgi:hypothetical protein